MPRIPIVARGLFRGVALAMLLLTAPFASAQFSPSYKFLDAVRKKDGEEVNSALSNPASQMVNTRDSTTGETAMHIVTARRDLVWMQFLVAKGANVNSRDNAGATPLTLAVGLGFIEGVDFLISSGARVDDPNNTGETPLVTAVHRHDPVMVRTLLAAGANPDRPDNSGRSARDYATLDKNTAVLSEIDAATRAGKGNAKPTYGPTF